MAENGSALSAEAKRNVEQVLLQHPVHIPAQKQEITESFEAYPDDWGKNNFIPSPYQWRDTNKHAALPVTTTEMEKALSIAIGSKAQAKSLSQVLNNSLLSRPGKDTKFHAKYIRTQDTNHMYHYVTPTDLQVMQDMVAAVRDAGLDFSFQVLNYRHEPKVVMKLKDSSKAQITLMNPAHPEEVGAIVSQNGMHWQPDLNRLIFEKTNDDLSYSASELDNSGNEHHQELAKYGSVFSYYAYSQSEKDGNGQPKLLGMASPYALTAYNKHNSKAARRMTLANAKNIDSAVKNGTLSDVEMNADLSSQTNALHYSALDVRTRVAIALAGFTSIYNTNKHNVRSDMAPYEQLDNGDWKRDENGQPIVNPNAELFDNDKISYESATFGKTSRYTRRLVIDGQREVQFRDPVYVQVTNGKDFKFAPTSNQSVSHVDPSYLLKGDHVLDFKNVWRGRNFSNDYGKGRYPEFDPNETPDPNEFVNERYQNARIYFYQQIESSSYSSLDRPLLTEQKRFHDNLADNFKREFGNGSGGTSLERPDVPLDPQSQLLVGRAVFQGLTDAKASAEGVDDTALMAQRQALIDATRNDTSLSKVDQVLLAGRRASAFDAIVNQIDNHFGTAPLLNRPHEDLMENRLNQDYVNKYAKAIATKNDKDSQIEQLKAVQSQMDELLLKHADQLAVFDGIDDHQTKLDVVNSLTYLEQLQLLDQVPHDEDSVEGRANRGPWLEDRQQFQALRNQILQDYPLNKELNLGEVSASLSNHGSSVEAKSQLAQAAHHSRYARFLVGNNEYDSLDLQARAVEFQPEHAYTIQDLKDLDDPEKNPDNLDTRLKDYLDHSRGFRYVDANGKRVLDRDKDQEGVVKQTVEPKIKFSFDDPQNPLPGAFSGVGTTPGKGRLDESHLHLINEESPHAFLVKRLEKMQTLLKQNHVKVADDSIRIDQNGVVRINALVPIYTDDHQKVESGVYFLPYNGYQAYLHDKYQAADTDREANPEAYNKYWSKEGRRQIYNDHGFVAFKESGYLMSGSPDKEYYDYDNIVDADGNQVHFNKEDLKGRSQIMTIDFGQIFAPNYDNVVSTKYYRFDDENQLAGQKKFVMSRAGIYLGSKRNPDGSLDVADIRRKRELGLGKGDDTVTFDLGDFLDKVANEVILDSISTVDMGKVSKLENLTKLNTNYRNNTYMTALDLQDAAEKPTYDKQIALEDASTLVNLPDSLGNELSISNAVDEMVENVDSARHRFNYELNNTADGLDLKDPKSADIVKARLSDVAYNVMADRSSNYDSLGGITPAMIGTDETIGYYSGSESAQGGKLGLKRYRQMNTSIDANGRIKSNYFRYTHDVLDADGKLIHQKGDYVLDPVTGKVMPHPDGSILDDSLFNNYATKNAADRELLGKEQYSKAKLRISDMHMATMALGAWTMEDAAVVSEDFVRKNQVPLPAGDDGQPLTNADGSYRLRRVMIGDKTSDNGGNKSTVSVVIPNKPDTDDPAVLNRFYDQLAQDHLLDIYKLFADQKAKGLPLEVVSNPTSQISRGNGATTATYLDSHLHKLQVLNADGTPVNDELISVADALADHAQHADHFYQMYQPDPDGLKYKEAVDGKAEASSFADRDYIPARSYGQDGELKLTVLNADQLQRLAEFDKPMTFKRLVKDENGNYQEVETPVETGATLNYGMGTITDQLVDEKVTKYSEKRGSKGRKLSYLSVVSDQSKKAYHMAGYHFKNGEDEAARFKAGLLACGIDLDDKGKVSELRTGGYDRLDQTLGSMQFKVPVDDLTDRIKTRKADQLPHSLLEKVPAGNGVAEHYNLNKNGESFLYGTAPGKFDVNGGSFFESDHGLQLTADAKQFLTKLGNSVQGSLLVAPNSNSVKGQSYDAGSDFLNQLPDGVGGGLLKLPEGLSVKNLTGVETDRIYVLPERMRVNMVDMGGHTMRSDLNRNYQKLGVALANYQLAQHQLEAAGIMHVAKDGQPLTEGQLEENHLIANTLGDSLGVQRLVTAVENDVNRIVLGSNNPKSSMLKNDILGGYAYGESVTSQVSNNPTLPMDVVEISPAIAKAIGLVKNDPKAHVSYAHIKGHPDWDRVHLHRDPIWREQGSLGMRVMIRGDEQAWDQDNVPENVTDITNVRLSPAMISLLDGDYDGDNVGIVAPKDSYVQAELKSVASADRWMMDNNGNNTLLNINTEIVDTASRVNPELSMIGTDGVEYKGRLHDDDFRKAALYHMQPQIFEKTDVKDEFKQLFHDRVVSADDLQRIADPQTDQDRELKQLIGDKQAGDHFYQLDGQAYSQINDGDFLKKLVDSEVKRQYLSAGTHAKMGDLLKSMNPEVSPYERMVSIPVQCSAQHQEYVDYLEGDLQNPEFRQNVWDQLPKDITAQQKDVKQVSDPDFLKALFENQKRNDANFVPTDNSTLQKYAEIQGDPNKQTSYDRLNSLIKHHESQANKQYKHARQDVDAYVQKMLGYDAKANEKTGEIETTRGAVSNLTGDGVSYLFADKDWSKLKTNSLSAQAAEAKDPVRIGLNRYAEIGAKGTIPKVNQLIGAPGEHNGYIHHASQGQLTKMFDAIQDPQTGKINEDQLRLTREVYKLYQEPQVATQNALKEKTDFTSEPGGLQKNLTTLVEESLPESMRAINHVGQSGTQKVLGIKREPVVAQMIGETLKEGVMSLLQNKDIGSPAFALQGNEADGRLGTDANLAAVRAARLQELAERDHIKGAEIADPKSAVYTDEKLVEYGAMLGMKLDPDNKRQMQGFRTTMEIGSEGLLRADFYEELDRKGLELWANDGKPDEMGQRHYTKGAMIEALDYLYNDPEHGMDLGVPKNDFVVLADQLAGGGNQPLDAPVESIYQYANRTADVAEKEAHTGLTYQASIPQAASNKGWSIIEESVKNGGSFTMFGAEGSKDRLFRTGGMSDSQLQNKLRLDTPQVGAQTMPSQLKAFENMATDETTFKVDDVDANKRLRKVANVQISAEMAKKLNLEHNQPGLLTFDDHGVKQQLGVNLVVKPDQEAPVLMEQHLYSELASKSQFKLSVDNSDQKSLHNEALTDFIGENLQNMDNFLDYQTEAKRDDHFDAQKDVLKQLSQESRAVIANRETKDYALDTTESKIADGEARDEKRAAFEAQRKEQEAAAKQKEMPKDNFGLDFGSKEAIDSMKALGSNTANDLKASENNDAVDKSQAAEPIDLGLDFDTQDSVNSKGTSQGESNSAGSSSVSETTNSSSTNSLQNNGVMDASHTQMEGDIPSLFNVDLEKPVVTLTGDEYMPVHKTYATPNTQLVGMYMDYAKNFSSYHPDTDLQQAVTDLNRSKQPVSADQCNAMVDAISQDYQQQTGTVLKDDRMTQSFMVQAYKDRLRDPDYQKSLIDTLQKGSNADLDDRSKQQFSYLKQAHHELQQDLSADVPVDKAAQQKLLHNILNGTDDAISSTGGRTVQMDAYRHLAQKASQNDAFKPSPQLDAAMNYLNAYNDGLNNEQYQASFYGLAAGLMQKEFKDQTGQDLTNDAEMTNVYQDAYLKRSQYKRYQRTMSELVDYEVQRNDPKVLSSNKFKGLQKAVETLEKQKQAQVNKVVEKPDQNLNGLDVLLKLQKDKSKTNDGPDL